MKQNLDNTIIVRKAEATLSQNFVINKMVSRKCRTNLDAFFVLKEQKGKIQLEDL